MKITFANLALPSKGSIAIGVMEERKLLKLGKQLDRSVGGLLSSAMASSRFTGKAHQSLSVFTPKGRVVLYGLGKGENIDELWAEAAGGNIRAHLAGSGESEVSVVFEGHPGAGKEIETRAARLAYGAVLRAYSFDKYKTKRKAEDKPTLKKMSVLVEGHAKARARFKDLSEIATGVALTRDLVSEPPNVLHPESYAERCKSLKDVGIKVEILGEAKMEKLGMGALLGVSRGSHEAPALIVLEYFGTAKSKAPTVIVGKGVSFDTGGISLKPSAGMDEMKMDMSGAATTLATLQAVSSLKLPINVVGIVGAVENMPGGSAIKPGDILKSMSGKTIEVLNTDAEGRLVLADALTYAGRYKPKEVIDLATLTGAVLMALGHQGAAVIGTDPDMITRLKKAGDATGERVWEMPLWEEFEKAVKSDIADLKNIASPGVGAGTITAAAFLKAFAGDQPWTHIDIAGTAWGAEKPYTTKGASGYGVRLLLQYLTQAK